MSQTLTNELSDWREYFLEDSHLINSALAVYQYGEHSFMGSATYIRAGLFVTAKHVIEEPLKRSGILKHIVQNKIYGQLDGNYTVDDADIKIIQFGKIQYGLQVWHVDTLHFNHDTDLAIVVAHIDGGPLLPFVDELPVASLNIHPKLKSKDIFSYGYVSKIPDINRQNIHNVTHMCSKGELKKAHFDRASASGIFTYEANLHIEHMMSGGPVVDDEGSIIGINSTEFNIADDSETRTFIAPILTNLFVKFPLSKEKKDSQTSLYELSSFGAVEIVGREHVTLCGTHIIYKPSKLCTYCYP